MKLKELKAKRLANKAKQVKYFIEHEIPFSNEEERVKATLELTKMITYKAAANREKAYHIHKGDKTVALRYRKRAYEPLI